MEEHVKILNKGNMTNNFLSSQSGFLIEKLHVNCYEYVIIHGIYFFLRNVLENEFQATIKNEIKLANMLVMNTKYIFTYRTNTKWELCNRKYGVQWLHSLKIMI